MNIQTIKTILATEHDIYTRNWSDEAVLSAAAGAGIDTGAPVAPTTAPVAPPTTATVKPTTNDPEKSNNIALAINAAINAALSLNTPALDEDHIISLIKEHAPEAPTTKIEITQVDQTKVKMEGVFHDCFEDCIDHITSFPNQLFLYGSSGSGKSYTAKQVSEALDMPLFSQGAILTKFETLGSVTPTAYLKSTIRNWLESDKGLLLIDEIDSSNPQALVTIMALFDDQGSMTFPDGKTFTRCAATHPIIVTANTTGNGATSKYNGRVRLDAAFKARFVMLEHGYNDTVEDSFASSTAVDYVRRFRSEIERLGLEGSIVTPRHTKMIGQIEHKKDCLRLINNILKQGLTSDEFTTVLNNVGAL